MYLQIIAYFWHKFLQTIFRSWQKEFFVGKQLFFTVKQNVPKWSKFRLYKETRKDEHLLFEIF